MTGFFGTVKKPNTDTQSVFPYGAPTYHASLLSVSANGIQWQVSSAVVDKPRVAFVQCATAWLIPEH